MKSKNSPLWAINPAMIFAVLSTLVLLAPAHGELLLHWKLDEANGDYTGGGYREEVTGDTSITREVPSGTSVTEGEPGLSPDGGTSMRFVDTDPDSYLDAGSVEDTGTHVSGPAGSPLVLGANLTLTAWFNADSVSGQDSIVLSNQFSAGTGFMFGPRGTNLFMDFGNTRATYPAALEVGQDYFVAVRMDLDGDVNFGWEAAANHRISLYSPTTETWQHWDGGQQKTGLNLQNLSIGRFTNGGREFNGRIDDVRIYDETLTQEDLDALVGVSPPAADLVLGIVDAGTSGEFIFTWNGEEGVTYNILGNPDLASAPSAWTVVPGLSGVTSPQTILLSGENRFFVVQEAP